jgi:hypothetical protein
MPAADLGSDVLLRLGEVLGVKSDKTAEELGGVWWQLWGAPQRAWLEAVRRADGTRRVQLRTGALKWFPGSIAQLSELSAELPVPTLAGIVRRVDQPSRLELATSFEVREDTIDWILTALPAAARMQAAEARLLSQSKALGRVGLIPEVDVEAKAPSALSLRRGNLLHDRRAPKLAGPSWDESEISECADVLKAQMHAHTVRTAQGFHASFRLRSGQAARSILEVTTDCEDPLFGRGLLVVLSTPVRGGTLGAMALNEREVGSFSRGHALGGWWAAKGGLLQHCLFFPAAIYQKGVTLQLLLSYARRAAEAAELGTGGR